MVKKIFIIGCFSMLMFVKLLAQPNLVLSNDEVEFEDGFNRLLHISLLNTGNQSVTIDTVIFNSDFYNIRFDKQDHFPLSISQNDSVKMDIRLTGYFMVTSADTTEADTLLIKGNLKSQTVKDSAIVKVKIDFEDDHPDGTIEGIVKENNTPLKDAFILFFYDGIYKIKEAKTDNQGRYSESLPSGNYIIAAAKDSFYVSFYDQKFDPLDAAKVELKRDSTKTIDFHLTRMTSTNTSIGGFVIDANTNSKVRSGIVIVRRGRHTPSKISVTVAGTLPSDTYSTFIRSDGSYLVDNIIQKKYYLIQSFSNYFLPSYYSTSQTGNVFWQQSDSVLIDGDITGIDINMPRDSAFGKGSIGGVITLGQNPNLSFSNIIVYAKSPTDGSIFNYSYVDNLGNYNIINLPQGNYKIVAQNVGTDDAESSQLITINLANVAQTGININYIVTSVDNNNAIPNTFELFQNYPNPFNPSTIISYQLSTASKVILKIYDVLGREVSTLVNKEQPAGNYKVNFDASTLASGVYLYRVVAGNFVQTKKMIFLK